MSIFSKNLGRPAKLRNKQQGLAMVETVICIPLVLVIMLAVAELGNAILQYNAVTQFARDGARYASVEASPGSSNIVDLTPAVIIQIQNIVAYGQTTVGTPLMAGLTPANVTVTDLGDGNVSVLVNMPYTSLFAAGIPNLMTGGSIGGGITLNAEVIMRVLT